MALREVVLDIETTGLFTYEGHFMVEIGMVELKDGKPTGNTYHSYINPMRDVPEHVSDIHGLTEKILADKPAFQDVAQEIRDFIGDSAIIITCRHSEKYTLDINFLEKELQDAGVDLPKSYQWINVRKWSEEMYGNDEAQLDKVLDRFNIDRTERDDNGHGALLDAALLASVYPQLKAAWFNHLQVNGKLDAPQPPFKNNKKPGM